MSAACDQYNITPEYLAQFITYKQLEDFKRSDQVDDISSKLKQTLNLTSSSSDNKNLSERPAIIFAGECCHSKYYSTAHGAFHSGMEQADKLLKFYENYNKINRNLCDSS